MGSPDAQALSAQVEQARTRVAGLAEDVRIIDDELAGLSDRRQQFQLLEQACGSLQQLEQLGVAELFWGDAARNGAEHLLSHARKHLGEYQNQVHELEARRQALLERIAQEQGALDILYDDLYQVRQNEERRKQEWLIEREVSLPSDRPIVMAWSRGDEADRRFRKMLAASLLICLLLGALIPMIDIPVPQRGEVIEVPERLAQLLREEQSKPIPPPAREEPKPEEIKPQEQEPQEQQPQKRNSDPAPESPQSEEPQSGPQGDAALASAQPLPQDLTKKAGILAFREKFSSLAQDTVAPRLGADARISSSDDASVGRTERAMLTTNAPGTSGGINLAALSRDVGGGGGGGGGMAGVRVTRATSAIGGGNGSGAGRPLAGDGAGAGRTDEEIQIVFDRYKAALYRLYNRELRKDPTLRGQMILRLTIEPDGSVSICQLQSSDMNAPELSAQVLDRVRTFNFGAKDVPAITIIYPIDFLPAA